MKIRARIRNHKFYITVKAGNRIMGAIGAREFIDRFLQSFRFQDIKKAAH